MGQFNSLESLKDFFSSHGHIGGYIVSTPITNAHRQKQARQYAENQLNILSTRAPGVLLMKTDPRFPKDLLRARFPIEWIFCHPKPLPSFPCPRVAIIGSRRSSPEQLDVAQAVAQTVNEEGGVVITGLATGADSAAYQAVHGRPRSLIAVLGNGIRKMYPASNKPMLDELIRSGGFILSEVPPDFAGNATSFILRNRIIASLADLVVAVSGAYASGTAHTIRFAQEAGVPIMSADPDTRSGITQLVLELGGRKVDPASIPKVIQGLGK